jgi:hypothetical protein
MTELSLEARSLFETVRECDGPTPADRERVALSIAVKIGVAAPILLASAPASAVASAAAAGVAAGAASSGVAAGATTASAGLLSTAAAKIFIAGVVGATLGVGVMVPITLYEPDGAESQPSVVVASKPVPPVIEGTRKASSTKDGEVMTIHDLREEPQRQAPATTRGPGVVAPSARRQTAPLTQEAELLAAVQRKLAANQPTLALELLDQHERSYAGGALSEERAAVRVFALCQAGQPEAARRHAAEFLRLAPRSPLVPRIRRSCGLAAEASAGASK